MLIRHGARISILPVRLVCFDEFFDPELQVQVRSFVLEVERRCLRRQLEALFYRRRKRLDEERVVKATNETIARYFNNRLKTIFPENGVAEPGVLRNSSNNPLYLLCFAAGNDRGAPIAVNIVNHILKEVR